MAGKIEVRHHKNHLHRGYKLSIKIALCHHERFCPPHFGPHLELIGEPAVSLVKEISELSGLKEIYVSSHEISVSMDKQLKWADIQPKILRIILQKGFNGKSGVQIVYPEGTPENEKLLNAAQ